MKNFLKITIGLFALATLACMFIPSESHTSLTDIIFGGGTFALASGFFSYNFTQGSGIEPYLLRTMDSVFGEGNNPAVKVDNLGFLNLLMSQNRTLEINKPASQGQIQYVSVKYKQRLVVGQTTTTDTCNSGVIINPYLEAQVNVNNYRQATMMLPDTLVEQYTADLGKMVNMQGSLPPTPAMVEVVEILKSAANGLLSGMDVDLQNLVVWGNNAVTGSNAPQTVNIDKDITKLSLTDGVTLMLTQCQQNEFATHANPQMYGSGLALNYFNQQAAKGLQFNGLNTKMQSNGFDFYYDQNAATVLGQNEVGIFSPDSLQLVEYMRYMGFGAGYKGNAFFGTFKLPIQMTETNIVPITFDFQLRYLSCPEDVAQLTDYYGATIPNTYRGWVITVSKYYGLFQPPTNAYRANDYLYNTNGALRFTITNN